MLWRGFNRVGSADVRGLVDDEIADSAAEIKFMQSAPYFDLDLNVVVVAPNGEWVSFSGVWYEPTSKYCYGEPVVTVPDHCLKGLGKAAVTESVRCAKLLGVKITFIGATLPIYQPIGFEQVYLLENGYVRTTKD